MLEEHFEQTVADPYRWSTDEASALPRWAATDDGSRTAYNLQEAGSDWSAIKVLGVGTGNDLQGQGTRARFTSIAWMKDGTGFLYSHYPEPGPADIGHASLVGHAVYFQMTLDTP